VTRDRRQAATHEILVKNQEKKIYHEGGQTDTRAQRGCGKFTTGGGQKATGQGLEQPIWPDSR